MAGYENNSRAAADSMILDVLRGAGVIGLHIEDISQLIGLPHKESIKRLRYLAQNNKVEQKPGQVWKVKDNIDYNANGNSGAANQQSLEETENSNQISNGSALPQINLPGIGKFASYKNSLQEYCQKSKQPVPQYKTRHDRGVGYIGTVSFSTNVITASKAMPNAKDAEMLVAFEALKQLGYFTEEVQYEHTSVLRKRKDIEDITHSAPPAKQHCPSGPVEGSSSFKSCLNELAQKNKLSLPTYNTVTTNNGFFSTVDFNGRQFKSAKICNKKKEAEQSAAKVAMDILSGNATESELIPQLQESDVKSMISEARAATVKTPTSLKNRLQEYCQRLKKDLPKYTIQQNTDRTYFSTVTVEGVVYNGEQKGNKKMAEMSAAENALKALGLMA